MSNEHKQDRQKKAVGSVAQKASEGADSLLSAAKEEVSAINQEEPDLEIPTIPHSEEDLEDDALEIPTPVLATIWFSENAEPPTEDELDPFEDAVIDAVVHDEDMFEFNDKVYSIDKSSQLEISAEQEERVAKSFGGVIEKLMSKVATSRELKKGLKKVDNVSGNAPINTGKKLSELKIFGKKDSGGFFGKLLKKLKNKNLKIRKKSGAFKEFNFAPLPVGQMTQPEAAKKIAPSADTMSKQFQSFREGKADGGEMAMPPELMDTYPNIPPEEMEAAKASQLPDHEMEHEYEEFILDQSLNEKDQTYLMDALEQDERLSTIFDRVMDVATEFSGAGAVKGNGTGVSDSIPARLSDGEFVFTKKAVDQLGPENLQKIMDDAERAYDESNGKLQMQYGGMVIDDEDPTSYEKAFLGSSEVSEDLKKDMLDANQMPRRR